MTYVNHLHGHNIFDLKTQNDISETDSVINQDFMFTYYGSWILFSPLNFDYQFQSMDK